MDRLDCTGSRAYIHLYMDRELSSEKIVLINEHIEHCVYCDCRFRFNRKVKELIQRAGMNVQVPARLRAEIGRSNQM